MRAAQPGWAQSSGRRPRPGPSCSCWRPGRRRCRRSATGFPAAGTGRRSAPPTASWFRRRRTPRPPGSRCWPRAATPSTPRWPPCSPSGSWPRNRAVSGAAVSCSTGAPTARRRRWTSGRPHRPPWPRDSRPPPGSSPGRATRSSVSRAPSPGWPRPLDRYGSRPLPRLLGPAIALAERGIRLTPLQTELLKQARDRLAAYDESRQPVPRRR